MPTLKKFDVAELAQAMFEEASDALFLFDPETNDLLDANPVAMELTKFALGELEGMSARYLFRSESPGDRQRLESASRKTAIFHSQEGYLLRTKQAGVWVPVNISMSRMHVKPKPLFLITARDMREQRDTQAKLKKAETELRQLMASISDCLWSAEVLGTGQWVYRYVSPVVEKVAGRPPESFVGIDSWEAIVHPEDRAAWRGNIARLRSGQPVQAEYRVIWPDGTVRWLRESVAVRRREDTGTLRLDAVVANVTGSKEMEEALRGSEMKLRGLVENQAAILNALPADIALVDANGNIIAVNDAWKRDGQAGAFLGGSAAVGENYLDWCARAAQDQPDLREIAPAIRGVLRAEREYLNVEYTYRVGTEQHWFRLIVAPEKGGPAGAVLMHTDVTERVRLGEELRQAQKMEAVGRLAGGVAHDFNNLLTVIAGYGEILEMSLPAGTALRLHAEEIRRAAERATGLTGQLLAFGRKQILAPRIVDLNALVVELEKMLRRLIGEDITLHFPLEPNLGRVRHDPGQVHQVLINLAVNARDAMPRGGNLTIATANVELDEACTRTRAETRPGSYVMLTVSDTGSGLSDEVRSHLFEPFFTTKEVGKGTGLGLSTVYGIVKQSGGHIEVASDLGCGCTFKIFLPRLDESLFDENPAPRMLPTPTGSETILLVEDEDMVRAFTRTVLRQNGYTVLEADNGAKALEIATRHPDPIALVVSDVVMPQMSGRELGEKLRPLRPTLKMLYLSGYTDDTVVRHGLLEADTAFLQKPFKPDELARKVREVLAQDQQNAPCPAS